MNRAYRQTLLGRLDERFLSRKPVKIALLLVLLTALVIPSVQFVIKIQEVDDSLFRESGTRHRTALGRWFPTAELLLDGKNEANPYGFGHWFPTPPFVLICLAPLTKLGYVGAAVIWSILKIAGFFVGMALIVRGMGRSDSELSNPRPSDVPVGVLLVAAVYSLRPIVSDITHGNLNVFMLVWLALAWALYVRRMDFAAGILLALAVATKLTPALAVVYFAWKREWRVLAGTVVGLALFFFLIPGLVLGFDKNWEYLRSWFDMLVAPFAIHGYAAHEPANQSLFGVAMRLLGNAGLLKIEDMPVELAFQSGMEDMARPATSLGRLLKPAITLPVLAALAFFCRTKTPDRRDVRRLLEFSLVLLAMLLLSERTWKHHATTLPIVFVAVWYALTCRPHTDRFRAWFVAGLVVQLVLLVILSEGILPEDVAEHLLDGGVFCWGLVLCFIQCTVILRARPMGVHPDR
ncbi:MAG TPA: glycosyltransferase family 87 protein [Phycisphaerae bacterium]|nr:glycosyltransferase family 87 protein [Phycisphaerae bacterium]